jgi:hypothetical protein
MESSLSSISELLDPRFRGDDSTNQNVIKANEP